MKKFIGFSLLALALPALASAQLTGIGGLITRVGELVQDATLVVAGIALLVFFWGLTKYILKIGGDAKAAAEGKSLMIWGLIALFVMVSVWGIIRFIRFEVLGVQNYDAPPIPTFN